jgi:hypothetical protein
MQVAYLPKKELIEDEISKNFRNGTYEVIYATTTGHPVEPAHFVMIPKVEEVIATDTMSKPKGGTSLNDSMNQIISKGISNHNKKTAPSALEIVIAIRGSGDIGDFISDSMLNATSYRSGKAHDGLAQSGQYIVDLYLESIKQLLKESGRERAKVVLVGYSLGAGVAAIAAMELNDYVFIGE